MSEINREAMLASAGEISNEQTSFFDYDGQEYKLDSSLIGKKCPFGGNFEEFNGELLTALREGWLNTDGSVTDSGKKEMERKKFGKAEQEKQTAEDAKNAREARKTSARAKELNNRKTTLGSYFEDIGYTGGWKLKADRRAAGGFYVLFKDTKGQIEEGKIIAKETFDDLLEFIRSELPKMIKYQQ